MIVKIFILGYLCSRQGIPFIWKIFVVPLCECEQNLLVEKRFDIGRNEEWKIFNYIAQKI